MSTGNTQTQLLSYIVAHGGANVAELIQELDLPDATVRRHLDKLTAEHLIEGRTVRQAVGRPHYHYRATDAGVSKERDQSQALAARLIAQIERGQVKPGGLAEGLAEQLVAEHRHQVKRDVSLETRVSTVVDALRSEGILDTWERTESGYRLHNHGCPYGSTARVSDCVCESDRLVIEKLLGEPVNQVGSLANGNSSCEYIINIPHNNDDSIQQNGPQGSKPIQP
jgi:predicted ArsR family transcriptional regulator